MSWQSESAGYLAHVAHELLSDWHDAAIGLGSNLGLSLAIVAAAWKELQLHPAIVPLAISSPYRSQPIDMDSQHWFVNAVGLIRTRLAPSSLLDVLHAIEARHGRIRSPAARGFQDRTLDLDLLLYDDRTVATSSLTIPHPRMRERLFVLMPLAEIAGDLLHPLAGQSIGALLASALKNYTQPPLDKICWEQHLQVGYTHA